MVGLKESVCDLAELELGFAGRVINAVLGLSESVCDLAERSWALQAELSMRWWDSKSLCVT